MTETPDPSESRPEPLHPLSNRNAGRIAVHLTKRNISVGDIAGLKRMATENLTNGTFWKMCFALGIENCDMEIIRTWATVARMIAISTKVGDVQTIGPHIPTISLGKALCDAGYSEARLKTLLAADPVSVIPLLERMSQYLHSREQQFNWNDAARLALTRHRSQKDHESDRTRIAGDYYREQYTQNKLKEN